MILGLRDEIHSLERCMAYSQDILEREEWRKRYSERMTYHNIQLERVLKTYAPEGFVQDVNVATGVDWTKDVVFTWGRMEGKV